MVCHVHDGAAGEGVDAPFALSEDRALWPDYSPANAFTSGSDSR